VASNHFPRTEDGFLVGDDPLDKERLQLETPVSFFQGRCCRVPEFNNLVAVNETKRRALAASSEGDGLNVAISRSSVAVTCRSWQSRRSIRSWPDTRGGCAFVRQGTANRQRLRSGAACPSTRFVPEICSQRLRVFRADIRRPLVKTQPEGEQPSIPKRKSSTLTVPVRLRHLAGR